MAKAFCLGRDLLIALALFLAGTQVLFASWPGALALLGWLLLLGAAFVVAKINAVPFANSGITDTYRRYFPESLRPLEYRRVSSLNGRLAFAFCILLPLAQLLLWMAFDGSAAIEPFLVGAGMLEVVGLFFYWRAKYILYKGKSQTRRRLAEREK